MNTFARALAGGLFLTVFATSAQAASAYGFPPAGDCAAFAAQGKAGYWIGRFSGQSEDIWDRHWPVSAQGCFVTQYECRRWINEMQSAAPSPAAMSCRRARG
jgi:hypothetical protein